MNFESTPLAGAFVIEPNLRADARGWFTRVYCKNEFAAIGHTAEWVQMNHSFTKQKGTVRGMHYQLPPFGEIKLIRCIAGAVYDVMVDLRKDSPGFLSWYAVELSAANKKMAYIPQGFAHGFQALTDDAELIYHHSMFYQPDMERGLSVQDPLLSISWPLPVINLSPRDQDFPLLPSNFKGI